MTSGSKRLTADGVVGTSGKPVRIYSVVALSASGGAGTLVLRNGTTATDTIYVQQDGTAASKTDIFNFAGGLTFPDGAFFDKDTNIDAVVINFEQLGY
jgi:hypothetical protein